MMETTITEVERIDAELRTLSSRIDNIEALQPRIQEVWENHRRIKVRFLNVLNETSTVFTHMKYPQANPDMDMDKYIEVCVYRISAIRRNLQRPKDDGPKMIEFLGSPMVNELQEEIISLKE